MGTENPTSAVTPNDSAPRDVPPAAGAAGDLRAPSALPDARRVVLVGAGDVGIAYAYALVNQGIVDDLSIIDLDTAKVTGEVMDLNHGVAWAPSATRVTIGDYADCADAGLVVLCAGAAQKPGETRLDLVRKNLAITRGIVEQVMAAGFDGILLVASNPVDVLAYAAWRFSGLPASRVLGSGTALDSARLRFMLGELYGVAPTSVHASIIGEHGDTELAALSVGTVSGRSLGADLERTPGRRAELERIFADTRDAAYRIIDAKGSTSYGIGMALARITRAIVQDEHVALPVSTLLDGEYGVRDVYLGTPSIVARSGVVRAVELDIDAEETARFAESAASIGAILRQTGLLKAE